VLGVLGVAFTNSLIESDLFYPQLKKGVGGCWGCWGWCWAKKCPPKSGGDGYFACKGGAKLWRSLRWCGGGLGLLGGFWRPFLCRSGCGLGCFSYLCAMATLQVGSVAAKAAMRSEPVSGRRKTKAKALQKTPKPSRS